MVEGANTHYAMCILNPDGGSTVSGVCKYVQVEGQSIQINATMNGLTPGLHGFHVHQFGKFSKARANQVSCNDNRQPDRGLQDCGPALQPRRRGSRRPRHGHQASW